jgi:hypothetical protein
MEDGLLGIGDLFESIRQLQHDYTRSQELLNAENENRKLFESERDKYIELQSTTLEQLQEALMTKVEKDLAFTETTELVKFYEVECEKLLKDNEAILNEVTKAEEAIKEEWNQFVQQIEKTKLQVKERFHYEQRIAAITNTEKELEQLSAQVEDKEQALKQLEEDKLAVEAIQEEQAILISEIVGWNLF